MKLNDFRMAMRTLESYANLVQSYAEVGGEYNFESIIVEDDGIRYSYTYCHCSNCGNEYDSTTLTDEQAQAALDGNTPYLTQLLQEGKERRERTKIRWERRNKRLEAVKAAKAKIAKEEKDRATYERLKAKYEN